MSKSTLRKFKRSKGQVKTSNNSLNEKTLFEMFNAFMTVKKSEDWSTTLYNERW
ncbi:hypothetical protein RYX56_06130 [Alkalihalophilus lindianensis]|uniref:Transposase n=1 Tax=Alkalihalophilus lindianensis TaxID=1630542 RepID=A0ABU3X7U0_9BACI|nr:hypothetical protein [Alkalihalophilus lindianensis]MDV2683952.1 hypothetical protein [Alkalihalophilus lindianensis]